jgi:hypothetical protein
MCLPNQPASFACFYFPYFSSDCFSLLAAERVTILVGGTYLTYFFSYVFLRSNPGLVELFFLMRPSSALL